MSRVQGHLALVYRVFVCSLLLLGLATNSAFARTFRSDDGNEIDAVLVRVKGETAILNLNGKVVRVPFSRLSQRDLAYVQAFGEIQRTREWTKANEDSFRGRFENYVGGELVFSTRGGEQRFPVEELCEADWQLLSIATDGQVPDMFDRLLGDLSGRISRKWTDVEGKTIIAEYRGLEDKYVVLFMNNREYRVAMSRLSMVDQSFVHELVEREKAAQAEKEILLANSNAGRSQSGGASRPRPPRSGFASGGSPASDMLADMHERTRKLHERRLAEQRERDRKLQAQMAAQRSRMQSQNAEMFLRSSRPPSMPSAPRISPSLRHRLPGISRGNYEYQCESCNKTWTSSREYRVGDRCPKCGVRFDEYVYEHGNSHNRAGRWPRIKLRALGAAITGIVSLFAWLSRRAS